MNANGKRSDASANDYVHTLGNRIGCLPVIQLAARPTSRAPKTLMQTILNARFMIDLSAVQFDIAGLLNSYPVLRLKDQEFIS